MSRAHLVVAAPEKARSQASRLNGAKSRGPATTTGKAVSSRNALRHGLRAETVIVAPLETVEEWETHLAATLDALAPQSYVEALVAERVAVHAWKLRRVVRVTAALASAQQATALDDLCERRAGEKKRATYGVESPAVRARREERLDPRVHGDRVVQARELVALLGDLPRLDTDASVSWQAADDAMATMSRWFDADLEDRDPDDWTAGVLRERLAALADVETHELSPILDEIVENVLAPRIEEQELLAVEAERELTNLREQRLIVEDGKRAELLDRYETTAERGLFRALAEFRAIRATVPLDVTSAE